MSSIHQNNIIQTGFLVKDIKKATEKWAKLLNVPEPPIVTTPADQKETHAMYLGKPCYGRLYQSFFKLDNNEIELMQPMDDTPSIWYDTMEKYGEGMHHFSFRAEDMQSAIAEYEEKGFKLIQKGDFPGGHYAYIDLGHVNGTALEILAFD